MKDKNKTILIVEDEAIIALAQAETIKQFGYEVVTVDSGEQAVELAGKNEAISLILMDINLGKGIDGPEAAQQILAKRNIPIVFLTSHAEREMVEKVRGITRYGYIIKNSGNFVLQSSIEMAFELFEAHQKSRENEERYRLLADNASDTIWMMGLDCIFTYHSPAVEILRGYKPEEANRISIKQTVTPTSLSLIQRIFDEEEAKPVTDRWADRTIEIEVYRKDGTTIWTESSVRAVRDQEGNVIGMQGSTRDITDRKRAEDELILKSLVLDQVEDHVTITDLNGRIIYVNQSQVDILERSKQELVGQSTKIYGEDAKRGATQQEIMEKTLRDGAWRGEIVNFAADGSEHIMDLRTRVVHDAGGKVIALCGSATDITKRKLAEEMRWESEELLRQIVKHDPLAIAVHDLNMCYLAASERWLQDYNVKESDIIGKSHYEVFPEIPQRWKDIHQRCLAGAIEHNDDDQFERPDGSITYNRWEMRPWYKLDGRIAGVISYTEVITERKLAELTRKSIIERYNLATHAAGLGVWDWDIQKSHLVWDDRMYELYQIKNDDFTGTYEAWLQHIYPSDKDYFTEESQRALRGEKEYDTEFRIVWPDGTVRYIKACGQIVRDSEGNPLRQTGINYDITERKQAEETLRIRELYLSAIIENQPGLLWLKDLNSRFLAVNIKFANACGLDNPGLLIGKTDLDVWPQELAARYIADDVMVIKSGKPYMVEEPISDRGIINWFETYKAPIIDKQGKVIGTTGYSREITKRKKAEQTLQESEARYKRLLDSVIDYVYSVEINNGRPVRTVHGPGCKAVTGYSPEDYQADANLWYNMIHSDDRAAVVAYASDVIAGRAMPFMEHRIINRDGSIRWVRNTTVPHYDDQHQMVSYDSVIVDITQRKRAEEALRESEEKYRTILENIEDGYYDVDVKGNFTFFNDSICRILGYSQEEMIGMNNRQYTDKENAKKIFKTFNEVYRTGKPSKEFDYQVIRKDGTKRYMEVSISLQKDSSGNPIGFQGISRDITERKLAESMLRASEEKYRLLIENSHDNIYTLTVDGIITFVSPAWTVLLGYTMNQAIGQPLKQFIHPDDIPGCMEFLQKVRETGQRQKGVEYRVRRLDGSWRWHISSVVPLQDEAGTIIGFEGIARDITERKLAETKIKSLLAEKELILKEVHHRIKNDMNTISSLLNLQADNLKEPSAISALNDAKSRVDSMAVLYDKLYHSENLREMSVKDYLPSLVDEIVANFPNSKSVKIKKKFDDFILDVKRLQPLGIIINEILTNTMKHAFTGGRNGIIKASATLTGNHVSLIIQDNGNGMPESIDFENSTGFGLRLVRMLTKQLDGTIRIEREKGTRIILEFEK